MFKKGTKGFTLIELIIVFSILAIIAGIALHPLMQFYELWHFSNYRLELLWNLRASMQDLTKNIRMIKDANSIYAATPTQLMFDIEDEFGTVTTVTYVLSDDKLYKDGAVFIDKINFFGFIYYDENDQVIASPVVFPQKTNIRYIEIDQTLSDGGESISSTTKIRCRNLYY